MTEQPQKKRSILPFVLGGIVLIAGIGAAGVFGFRNFMQASQASAEAMPSNTLFYASLDVVNLLDPTALRRFDEAFNQPLEDAEVVAGSPEDVYAELDEQLADYGITFQEDIQSWIGRSIGAGVLGIEMGDVSLEPTDYVIVIEIRDRSAADEFLTKFSAENSTTGGSYSGVDYLIETDNSGGAIILGRSDSLMIWASSTGAFEQAVDAQNGESIMAMPKFTDVIAKLPEQRAVTLYADIDGVYQFQEVALSNLTQDPSLSAGLGTDLPTVESLREQLDAAGADSLESMAASLNISTNGFELDVASLIDIEGMSEELRAAFDSSANYSNAQAANMPESTLLYFGSAGIGTSWSTLRTSVTAGVVSEEDFEDSLTLAGELVGFDIEDELMPQLQGDFGLAIYEDAASPLADTVGLDLGLILNNGVADPSEMSRLATLMSNALVEQGFLTFEEDGVYMVDFLGTPVAAFGVTGDNFSIGTNPKVMAQTAEDASLLDNPLYQRGRAALPESMTVSAFANFMAINDKASELGESSEELNDLANRIPAMIAGSTVDDNGSIGRLIFLIPETTE